MTVGPGATFPADSADVLFARHLDLARLRGRRRGYVRCIFHDDRTPSLSIDLDRGLFHCFGCGVGGGLRRFAELVGAERPSVVGSGPTVARDALQSARRAVLDRERAAQRRRDRYRPQLQAADDFRQVMQAVDQGRALATAAGESEPVWGLLALVAIMETAAHADLEDAAT